MASCDHAMPYIPGSPSPRCSVELNNLIPFAHVCRSRRAPVCSLRAWQSLAVLELTQHTFALLSIQCSSRPPPSHNRRLAQHPMLVALPLDSVTSWFPFVLNSHDGSCLCLSLLADIFCDEDGNREFSKGFSCPACMRL